MYTYGIIRTCTLTSWSVKKTGGAMEAHIRWEWVARTRVTEDGVGGAHRVLAVVGHQGVQAMEHWRLTRHHWHGNKWNINLLLFYDHQDYTSAFFIKWQLCTFQPLPAYLGRKMHRPCTSESGCVLASHQKWKTTHNFLEMSSSPWQGMFLLHHPLQWCTNVNT